MVASRWRSLAAAATAAAAAASNKRLIRQASPINQMLRNFLCPSGARDHIRLVKPTIHDAAVVVANFAARHRRMSAASIARSLACNRITRISAENKHAIGESARVPVKSEWSKRGAVFVYFFCLSYRSNRFLFVDDRRYDSRKCAKVALDGARARAGAASFRARQSTAFFSGHPIKRARFLTMPIVGANERSSLLL